MKNFFLLVPCVFILIFITSCTEKKPDLNEIFPNKLNLSDQGVPVSILTPEDIDVKNNSDNFMIDVLLQSKSYHIQIYGQTATSLSCNTLAEEKKEEVKLSDPNFKAIIKEDDCGFIYELQVPGDTTKCYNFAYFRIQGDKSFDFSTTAGRRVPFTLSEVLNMYEAVINQE